MMALPEATPQIEERTEEELAEEPLYRVFVHNDEVTTAAFVVTVLQRIFLLPRTDALAVMLTAHHTGIAYVQTLPKGEAEKRIAKAQFAAGLEGFPLKFSMEPE